MEITSIVNYSNILSALFWFIAIIVSFLTLKQVQKININVHHDHSVNDNSTKVLRWNRYTANSQDNKGDNNRNAGWDYNEEK